ncbi:hypothetical protein DL96DRAFT_1713229 [Flagelloscypha sp. PMI_526]|nr:hypothetical protein DL96DRAFT_1713229 [Flagelloscypha sp. PMI_526]
MTATTGAPRAHRAILCISLTVNNLPSKMSACPPKHGKETNNQTLDDLGIKFFWPRLIPDLHHVSGTLMSWVLSAVIQTDLTHEIPAAGSPDSARLAVIQSSFFRIRHSKTLLIFHSVAADANSQGHSPNAGYYSLSILVSRHTYSDIGPQPHVRLTWSSFSTLVCKPSAILFPCAGARPVYHSLPTNKPGGPFATTHAPAVAECFNPVLAQGASHWSSLRLHPLRPPLLFGFKKPRFTDLAFTLASRGQTSQVADFPDTSLTYSLDIDPEFKFSHAENLARKFRR